MDNCNRTGSRSVFLAVLVSGLLALHVAADEGTWVYSGEIGVPGVGIRPKIDDDLCVFGVTADSLDHPMISIWQRSNAGTWEFARECETDLRSDLFFASLSTAFSDRTLVVGDYEDGTYGENCGAAHVYRLDPTTELIREGLLYSDSPAPWDLFGRVTAVAGSRWLAVSHGMDYPVSVYERDREGTWNHVAECEGSQSQTQDGFGSHLAAHGDVLAVTALSAVDRAYGEAYLFRRQPNGSWTEIACLEKSTEGFPTSVALSDDQCFVGANEVDNMGLEHGPVGTGKVYIYDFVTAESLAIAQTLAPPDSMGETNFGYGVAVDGDWLVVDAKVAKYFYYRDDVGVWRLRQSFPSPYEQIGLGKPAVLSNGTCVIPIRYDRVAIYENVLALHEARERPSALALSVPFPNPFNPSTSISYSLPVSADVSLVVHDVLGQPVRALKRGWTRAGEHTDAWDGKDDHRRDVSSGVYFVRLNARGQMQVRRVTLVR